MTQRNPYIILGIPFGSSREQANIAFARKARQLRQLGAEGRSRMTDLTWALNQIDEALRHPEAAMEVYRVPANPDAFVVNGDGVLSPAPERIPPPPGDHAAAVTAVQAAAAHEYLCYLVTVRAAEAAMPAP